MASLFPEGDVLSVRFVRNRGKKFVGSPSISLGSSNLLGKAFVEFATDEKLAAAFATKDMTFGENKVPLTVEKKYVNYKRYFISH